MSSKINNRGDRRKINYIKSKKDDFKNFKIKDKKATGNCEEATPLQERKLKNIDLNEFYEDGDV